MCGQVCLPDGRSLTSVADLRAEGWALMTGDIDLGPGAAQIVDDGAVCFCVVDVEAVLARNGKAWTFDVIWGDWHVT